MIDAIPLIFTVALMADIALNTAVIISNKKIREDLVEDIKATKELESLLEVNNELRRRMIAYGRGAK